MVENSDPHADLSVGQVADRAGVTVSTLHFYEATLCVNLQ